MTRVSGGLPLRWGVALLALISALTTAPLRSAPLGELLVDLTRDYFTLGSQPKYLGTVGGKVVFSANGDPNALVWITDGTPEGTHPLPIWSGDWIYAPQLLALGTAGAHLFLLERDSGLNVGAVLAIDDQGTVTRILESADTWDFYYLDSPANYRVVGRKLALALSTQFHQQSDLAFIDGDSLALEFALAVPTGSVQLLGAIGNELVFSRDDYETSVSTLWQSSGTAATTSQYATLSGVPFGDQGVSTGDVVFFTVQDPANSGVEVWVTDRTAPGTLAVTALPDPVAQIGSFHIAGHQAYFVVTDATFGQELFVSDGRPGGTKAVTSFGYHAAFGDGNGTIAVSGHRAYFLATDGVDSYRLWLAGDRPETTRALVDNVLVYSSSRWIGAAGGSVFVPTSDELGLPHLVATDGTGAGTHEIQTGCTDPCFLYAEPLASTATTFYFTAPFAASIQETLYATRPPFHEATPLFSALKEGPMLESNTDRSFAIVGESVFFSGGQYVGGYSVGEEPWVTAGTPATTGMIQRLEAFESSLQPRRFRTTGGALAFSTDNGYPYLAWRRSTLGAAVEQVPGEYEICYYGSEIYPLAGRFIFRDCDDDFWSFAASGGPATRLTYFDYGSDPSQAANSQIVGALVGNQAWRVGDPAMGATLAQTIPLTEEARYELAVAGEAFILLQDFYLEDRLFGLGSDLTHFDAISPAFDEVDNYIGSAELGRGFFGAYPYGEEERVWTTDGTISGTRSLFPAEGWAFPVDAVRSASDWVVLASVYTNGPTEQQVWRTDGTAAGSSLLSALPVEVDVEGSRVAAIPGWVLFTRRLPENSAELWSVPAQGGPATALLPPGVAIRGWIPPFGVVTSRVFFKACDVAHGCELWVSEGTPETTRLFQDIRPGASPSTPDHLLAVGNELVFTADDGLHGVEPWHVVIDGGAACTAGHGALCLDDGRFLVRALWKAPVGSVGDAGELPLTPDTGAFWFFDPDNVELIVKAIDGGGTNGHEWLFYGALSNVEYSLDVTDSLTGEARRYFNPAGRFASAGDIRAFPSAAEIELSGAFSASASSGERSVVAFPGAAGRDLSGASGSCGATETRFCILEGRFAVEATWRDFQGRSGTARAGSLTDDTGTFWFFDEANVEVVVKAIDGSDYNSQFWIYFGALSNVEYTIRVTDTVTDAVREYWNPLGRFASFGDIAAFPAD